VPLGEATELYRVQFFEGTTPISEYQVATPEISLEEIEISAVDDVIISQGSQAYGWGAETIVNISSV